MNTPNYDANIIKTVISEKRRNGLLYGFLAGLAFSLAAWGVDAYLLNRAHAILPWAKLLLGGTVALVLCSAAGWLTARFDKPLISVLIWAIVGGLLAWVGAHLPFEGLNAVLSALQPELAEVVTYPYPVSRDILFKFSLMILVVGSMVGGGLQMYFVDSATSAGAPLARFLSLGVSIPIFGVLGMASLDVMYNQPLREPVVTIDQLLQFAIDHRGQEVDPRLRREMHLGALGAIDEMVAEPYELAVGSYGEDMTLVTVLANFQNGWAQCQVVGEVPANQATVCRPIELANFGKPALPGSGRASPKPTQAAPTEQAEPGAAPTGEAAAADGTGSGAGEQPVTTPAPEATAPSGEASLETAPRYTIEFSVDAAAGTYQGTLQVDYTNAETGVLYRLHFRLLPNGGGSLGNGSLEASLVEVDGQPVQTALLESNSTLQVPLPAPLAPGEQAQVRMSFFGTLARDFGGGYGIFNSTDEIKALAAWYPTLAVYDEDGWNLDPLSPLGDPVYSDMAYYTVTMTVPAEMVVAATGAAGPPTVDADLSTYEFSSGPARDFFIIMSPNFEVKSQEVDGVQINSYYFTGDDAGGSEALSVAADSLKIYNQQFGPYPYSELDVVEAPLQNAAGVEFPGIVLIGSYLYDNPSQPTFVVATAHEVAHQWWYNVVGNDVYEDPWLDEALTTYSSVLYYEFTLGRSAALGYVDYWESRYAEIKEQNLDAPITESVAYFDSLNNPRVYSGVVYNKGALFFHNLRRKIGDPAFFQALRDYYQTYQYGIARPADLLNAFEAASGQQLDDFYQEWLYSK